MVSRAAASYRMRHWTYAIQQSCTPRPTNLSYLVVDKGIDFLTGNVQSLDYKNSFDLDYISIGEILNELPPN